MIISRHGSDSNGLTTLPTATGGIARAAFAKCIKEGIPVDPLLWKSGLTASQIENPEIRITVQSQIKFLNLAAKAMSDEFLGFHLAQSFELREIGLLYYVMASSDRLGDALQRGVHYSSINNEGVRLIYISGKKTAIRLEYINVQRYSDRHQIEFFMTALIRLCRHLVGRQLSPRRVVLTHVRTNISPELRNYFGCNVIFAGDVDEITFANTIETIPLLNADPYLNSLLLKYCDEVRSRRAIKSSELKSSIENAIVPLLPHRKIQASEVAKMLGLSRRTFARRLMSEQMNFAGILHNLRVDLAKRYLRETSLSISTIAWLLGYNEVASFSRAFKRWCGKTPKEARLAEKGTL